jgi:polysaccharide biosynthesis transport protein
MSEIQIVRPRSVPRTAISPEKGVTAHLMLTVLRRWWMVAAPVGLLLAAGSGVIVYLLFEPSYEAAAWFKIEERTPFLAFETKDDGRSKLFFQTQIETIRSPLVLGPVIKRPEIARMPEIARQPDKMAWLGKQIKVTPVGESELFTILYSSSDPNSAAQVVNAVTNAYFLLRDQSDAERTQRVIDMLDREKDNRSKEVARLRDNVRTLAKDFTGKGPFVGSLDVEKFQRGPLADLDVRLITAQLERTVLEARIKAAEEEFGATKRTGNALTTQENELLSPQEVALRDAMVDKVIEENTEVQRRKAIIADKRSNLEENERVLAKGKANSLYARLANEVGRDERSLDDLRHEIGPRVRRDVELAIIARRTETGAALAARRMEELAKMRSDWTACCVMEQMLKQRYDEQRKNIEQNSGGALEFAFKRDELARAEKVFELIAQRSLQLQTERSAPARVTLMQSAEPPDAPVERFPFRNLALATLAAFCLPFALAIGWERLIGRVGDSQSLAQQSALAVLGEITHLPTRAPSNSRSTDVRTGYEIRLFEESIDSLRTNLALSDGLAGMRVLTVTSAANHEGKTSVAAQLAVSFARATGEPLLLIDGDMRSPDVHRVFEIPLEPGLAKVLAGECSLEEAIVTTWGNQVHLLPAGRLGTSPHTLLGNGAWKSLLATIPAQYRYVLIDTPPVLAASEALVLAKAADAALVCVMHDVSRVDQVRDTIERLAAAGCRTVGTVLNGVPTRHYARRYGNYAYLSK